MGFLADNVGLISGIISIVVGLVIIIWPRLIAYLIGGYLLVVGIIMVLAAL
ncbi:MAG: hypothetical protein PHT28_01990 [Dehalococcoidales bacterium]|jgi:uncharacterized membrane protein HdeD (DUF308 family)|nr:hypothetical protein [Dehalococcoidales bacterium]MDD2471677.1 hypothetical protein [Dehalococcoidales bacterium]MDD3264410.1 hypothetical protein [Dehalococcoidales bacterium]MDD4230192.1 hypothetical protein [Dehalococcoidales bacterium]MDD4321951.1 hypothetical protein [Dehalococcoidales bacterium]